MSSAPAVAAAPSEGLLALADWDVHVWIAHIDSEFRPRCVAAWRRWLLPGELAGVEQIANQERRTRALISRVMRRAVPSRYHPIAPPDWRFRRTEHGKPELIEPGGSTPLRLSLASTRGFVVCAVTRRHDLGVDAERTDPLAEAPTLSRELFSAGEADDTSARHASGDPNRFYDYWTLREAYGKATGSGLDDALSPITILLREGDRPRLTSTLLDPGEAAGWHLELLHNPAVGLTVAVAFHGRAALPPTLTVCRFPLDRLSLEGGSA